MLVKELVEEVLAMSGSKQRYTGIVESIDQMGSTAIIRCGDKTFLAWNKSFRPGMSVTFRIDQLRAIDVTPESQPPQG